MDFSEFFTENKVLQVNKFGNQERFEKALFTLTLSHNFAHILFRIQTKDFSDILNEQRAPSLKQSVNCGYFAKALISFLFPNVEHFNPDWAHNFLLLRILEIFHDDKTV